VIPGDKNPDLPTAVYRQAMEKLGAEFEADGGFHEWASRGDKLHFFPYCKAYVPASEILTACTKLGIDSVDLYLLAQQIMRTANAPASSPTSPGIAKDCEAAV
jgi:hypothetical protein